MTRYVPRREDLIQFIDKWRKVTLAHRSACACDLCRLLEELEKMMDGRLHVTEG